MLLEFGFEIPLFHCKSATSLSSSEFTSHSPKFHRAVGTFVRFSFRWGGTPATKSTAMAVAGGVLEGPSALIRAANSVVFVRVGAVGSVTHRARASLICH